MFSNISRQLLHKNHVIFIFKKTRLTTRGFIQSLFEKCIAITDSLSHTLNSFLLSHGVKNFFYDLALD
jgi:hypothetical protein